MLEFLKALVKLVSFLCDVPETERSPSIRKNSNNAKKRKIISNTSACVKPADDIGLTMHGSPGVSYRQMGNTVYGSDGSYAQRIGSAIYHSDGSTTQQIGNAFYKSDGIVINKIGNSSYGPDGSVCTKINDNTYCN